MKQTEFQYIDATMINVRNKLKDLSDMEAMELELIYQLKRIADSLDIDKNEK